MGKQNEIEPVEALDRFFSIIRERANSDPLFARQLSDAIGHTVVFRGEEAIQSIDPIMVARQGANEFRETFLSFSAKDLKKILKDFGLASAQDMKGKNKPALLVDLMWERASIKLRDYK